MSADDTERKGSVASDEKMVEAGELRTRIDREETKDKKEHVKWLTIFLVVVNLIFKYFW